MIRQAERVEESLNAILKEKNIEIRSSWNRRSWI